jgi:very-short-patch-repair endonuclease
MTNIMSERARRLRKEKTLAERKLWRKLREVNTQGFHFRQQAPIGPYIADFADLSAKLIIEADGSQHGLDDGVARDVTRTRWLEANGFTVLRFWNNDILTNMDGVMTSVLLALGVLKDESKNTLPDPAPGEGIRRSPP